MKYATIENNNITEFPVSELDWRKISGISMRKWVDCSDSTLLDIGVVRVQEDDKPTVAQRTQVAELNPKPTLVGGVWSQQWIVSDKSVEEVTAFDDRAVKSIKREANRRIITIAPEWKQSNMLARGLNLLRKGEANLTTAEALEVSGMDSVWTEIQRIRSVSDTLEAADPPPADFADDKYWII
jgi:hypothetical protein